MDNECSYIEDYQQHGLIGDGGQASVYLVSKNFKLYAAKMYKSSGPYAMDAFKIQTQLLQKLKFKHLINIISSNKNAKIKFVNQPQIIRPVIWLQFAGKGQLFDYIKSAGRFTGQICRALIKQLISAIQFMHSNNITHRDLKLQNILIDDDFILRVSDLGQSTNLEGQDGDGLLYTGIGTQGYRPPQMEAGEAYTGLQADLFAIGVILFIIYTGGPPFESTKNTDQRYKYFRQHRFQRFWKIYTKSKPIGFYPQSFKKLIQSFFSYQLQNRPTFESLRNDPWLNQNLAIQSSISTQLNNRYEKMKQKDPVKQNIEEVKFKLQFYKKQLEQKKSQTMVQEKQEDSQEQIRTFRGGLTFYEININSIPLSEKFNLISTKVSPEILLAWLQSFIKQSFGSKNIFIDCPIYETLPAKYSFDFNKSNNKIQIELEFRSIQNIEEPNEQQTEKQRVFKQQLYIEGQLVKLRNGEVSVQWGNGRGNAFWLACLVSELNDKLKELV